MGERVFVKPVRAQAADDPGVRVDYAKSDVNPAFPTFSKAAASARYAADRAWEALEPWVRLARQALAGWARRMGGVRQITFAMGMTFTLGGLGAALAPANSDAAVWMALGGLLIGLAVRVSQDSRG